MKTYSMSATITKFDFNKICRICLEENINKISIFHSDILSTLQKFTSVNVKIDDEFPKEICTKCVRKTYECAEFKKLCNDSEILLYRVYDAENESKNWFNNNELPTKQEIKSEPVVNEDHKDDTTDFDKDNEMEFDENYSTDNDDEAIDSDNKNFKLPADGKRKLSMRKARINWVMTLSTEKCDTTKLLCKLCNKTLVNLSSLGRHMETHDSNRKFLITCNICCKGFYEKGNYLRHIQRHKRDMKYKCEHCSKQFYELNVLSTHLRKIHKVTPMNCTKCDKEFIIQKQLDIHLKKHSNDFEHKCSQCGKGYFLLRRLKEHLLTHKMKYICELCNKIYKNYTSLKSHTDRYHKSKVQEKQDCDVCGKNVLHLKQHMLIHSGDRMFKCQKCFKTFYRRCDMVAHVKRKHDEQEKPQIMPYLCNICGKRKLSNSALQQHIIHAHTSEKTQKCDLCDKRFKTDNALKGHIRYSHKDVRNYKCTVCTKSFYTNVILRNHMRTHTGERPYVCHICNRAFVQSSTLRTHMKIHVKADYDNVGN